MVIAHVLHVPYLNFFFPLRQNSTSKQAVRLGQESLVLSDKRVVWNPIAIISIFLKLCNFFELIGYKEKISEIRFASYVWGSTSPLVSLLCLVRSWIKSSWELYWGTWKIRRWFMTANTASLKENPVWKIWWPFMMHVQCWWIREEQLLSFIWTCEEHLTLACTSLPLNWRHECDGQTTP